MGELLKDTKRFMFEINNQCVYANKHKKCPIHLNKEPQTLPTKIIYDVFDFMAEEKFEGRVSFHNYNDPMTDPRLFLLIDKLKNVCPKCFIFIMTNGWNLDQEMLNELVDHCVEYVEVSAYSPGEGERLEGLKPGSIKYKVHIKSDLDDRMDIYTGEEVECKELCFAPLSEIVIRSNGDVALCCFDWDGQVTFGNLNKQSLKEILQGKRMFEAYKKLKEGKREFPVCKRCGRRREEEHWEHKYGRDK